MYLDGAFATIRSHVKSGGDARRVEIVRRSGAEGSQKKLCHLFGRQRRANVIAVALGNGSLL